MSDLIDLTIDGKTCTAKEGETLLNIARSNDIFIPAICYLTRCSPTLACRLCLVEADGKQVYACNAKAKDGMDVKTVTPNIVKERRAIMEVYDVNHPLQCGVCDQSGECELQNYSLYEKVDSQSYATPDVHRPTAHWGVMNYDPGLCIVCEKCVTVCKDMIGSNALSTVKRGAEALAKDYKTSMPKDAYSMWNKLNKSIIGFDESSCIDCGECISVCPVGALVSSDFQYKSNAWELTKIPASNPHSSDCSLLYYEVKHHSIENSEKVIYRVTNDSHYTTLSGAARFGYDFENSVASKDTEGFKKAVESIKECDTFIFNSYITNEEAYILQKLKESLGFKLVNSDAKAFKEFMDTYSSVSGKNLYNGTLKDVHDSNFVISVGSMLKNDHPSAKYAYNNSVVMNKGAGLYFHPVQDKSMEGIGKKGKTTDVVYHKPLKEEYVLLLILDLFAKELPDDLEEYLDSFKEKRVKTITETIKEKVVSVVKDEESGEEKEVSKMVPKKVNKDVEYTYTKILDELSLDASFLDTIETLLAKKDSYSLIVGEDVITHPNSKNLAKLCAFVEKYTEFSVVVLPTQTNTLGVSLICDLDDEVSGKSVGYNMKADFELSALGDGDLDMPALNQQEGTFVNVDKRVVPTNAALAYKGYVLNDLANALGLDAEYTIDYTSKLPTESGFKEILFDDLPNEFLNSQVENRGYVIDTLSVESSDCFDKVESISLGENLIYRANPINQFNEFTAKAHQLDEKSGLYASKAFLDKKELACGDRVVVKTTLGEIEVEVVEDKHLLGEIAYLSTFDKNVDTKSLFAKYRFSEAEIRKA